MDVIDQNLRKARDEVIERAKDVCDVHWARMERMTWRQDAEFHYGPRVVDERAQGRGVRIRWVETRWVTLKGKRKRSVRDIITRQANGGYSPNAFPKAKGEEMEAIIATEAQLGVLRSFLRQSGEMLKLCPALRDAWGKVESLKLPTASGVAE